MEARQLPRIGRRVKFLAPRLSMSERRMWHEKGVAREETTAWFIASIQWYFAIWPHTNVHSARPQLFLEGQHLDESHMSRFRVFPSSAVYVASNLRSADRF